jgi:hypothetical protein
LLDCGNSELHEEAIYAHGVSKFDMESFFHDGVGSSAYILRTIRDRGLVA